MEEKTETNRIAIHVWLAARQISSTLFLTTGGVLFGLALIGSLQAGRGTAPDASQEIADWELRAMFLGGASFFFAVVFTIVGIVGLRKVTDAFKTVRS